MKKLHAKNSQTALRPLFGVGIFSAVLLFVVTAFCLYSPTFSSHAADEGVNLHIELIPVVALMVNTNSLQFTSTPTAEGAFESKPVIATVDTNSSSGYELYFSSSDDETDMVSADTESNYVISSDFDSSVTSNAMLNNKWGYSTDNVNFSSIPTLADHAFIRAVDHSPSTTAERENTINIGIKVDTLIPADIYTKTVKITAIAYPPYEETSTAMQVFNCARLANIGDSTILRDIRDGNEYTVKKLADGHCWMTDNLRITNSVISSYDSNIVGTDTFTLLNEFVVVGKDGVGTGFLSENSGYYPFHSVTTGWVHSIDNPTADAPIDICPKDWRLPTMDEFVDLYENHYNSLELMMGEPNFGFYGNTDSNGELSNIDKGIYWSSTLTDITMYNYKNNGLVVSEDDGVFIGYSSYFLNVEYANVRCIAK